MQRSLASRSLAVAILGIFYFSTAQAGEDVTEALKNARKVQLEAPAYRMKMVLTEAKNKTSAMTVELVKPDMVYWKTEDNGQVTVEMWSDGKKTYIRQGAAGAVHESVMDVSSLLTQARQVDPLETLITNAREPKFVGHDEVNGTPASVYTFKSMLMNIDSSVKLWICDADQRPLKSDVDTHRELKAAPVHKKTVITYEYDPSITIVVPTN